MKLVLIPVGVMVLLSIFALIGFGTEEINLQEKTFNTYDTATSMDLSGNYLILYNSDGEGVCYWNGTGLTAGDTGQIIMFDYADVALWKNSTYECTLFYDQGGTDAVPWSDTTVGGLFAAPNVKSGSQPFSLDTSLGWIVLLGVILAVGTIAGITIFGSGLSDASQQLLWKGTFFLTVWSMLSLMAYNLILAGGFFVFILYFILTIMYVIGVVRETYGSGGNE